MTQFGYTLYCEGNDSRDLIEQAARAGEAGFDSLGNFGPLPAANDQSASFRLCLERLRRHSARHYADPISGHTQHANHTLASDTKTDGSNRTSFEQGPLVNFFALFV